MCQPVDMRRTECASGWSNEDREAVLAVTGFVTDVEEGFKTHGHFASQTETFASVLADWIMSICQAFSALFICPYRFLPSLLDDLLIEFIE